MPRDWKLIAAVAALTIVAVVRVASTHRVFSATIDEPVHLAGGYQWLTERYTIDLHHPPLARIFAALPLIGAPKSTSTDEMQIGNDLLYHGDRYEKTLARARSGNLLFLIIAVAALAAWTRRSFSRGVTILAVALFTTMPALLGHAGVVTNDFAAAATLVLALVALEHYLDAPSIRRAAMVGAAMGVGVLAKFSFLFFFPPSALVLLLFRRMRRMRWQDLGLMALLGFVVVWGGYQFHVGTPKSLSRDAPFVFENAAPEPFRGFSRSLAETPMPAPAFALGMALLGFHNQQGHEAYLLGELTTKGWWYYFPVVFFYKTPIPFLLLVLCGLAVLVMSRDRERLPYAAVALVLMIVAMTASINIGIRHILPIYAPLSIVAAYGVTEIWKRASGAFSRTTVLALLAWLFVGVAAAHPDYLPWFNELAQPNPAHIAVDSNLDWGQDGLRLARVVRELHIETLHPDALLSIRAERHGIHLAPLDPFAKTSGWVAVSETPLALKTSHGAYAWLRTYRPVRRIGKSIRLYFIP